MVQEWSFQPQYDKIFTQIFFGLILSASTIIFLYIVWFHTLDSSATWIVRVGGLILCAWVFCQIVRTIRQLFRWNWRQPEYLRFDQAGIHFHVFPHSGSLKYIDIADVTHHYEQRSKGKGHVWDEDCGIVIVTRQGKILVLNLERMIQSADGITFGSNSSVVIRSFLQYQTVAIT